MDTINNKGIKMNTLTELLKLLFGCIFFLIGITMFVGVFNMSAISGVLWGILFMWIGYKCFESEPTKVCPYCQNDIHINASVCQHCHSKIRPNK